MSHPQNRREFLHKSAWLLASLPLAGFALNACTKSATETPPPGEAKAPDAAGPKPVEESDPVAASLGYKHNAAAVDTAKWAKKAAADGAKQKCDTCQFYTAANGDWGNCQIIRSGLVAKGGWCNSWQAKPGT